MMNSQKGGQNFPRGPGPTDPPAGTGPPGLEEGKGQGYLASSCQYSNGLLGVCH